jgi:glycine oxidase
MIVYSSALPHALICPFVKLVPLSADVVVVGAGVIGMTTALELARSGLNVCVIERGLAGREASWAAGGILSPLPPDQPVPEIRELLDESLALFPDYCAALLERTGIDPEFWRCGAVVLDIDGKHERERWFPDVSQVRNPRLLKALVLALQHEGVSLIEQTPVLGWQLEGDRLTGVTTAQGTIACDQAVAAAGAWTGQLAQVQISPVKGQMLLLRGEPGVLDHIRMDHEAYVVPRRDGGILIGSTLEDAGFDVTPTGQARDYLLSCAVRLWPGAARLSVERHWAGLRPRPAGLAPMIGPASQIEGLFINTGHHRLGVTLSLASARRCVAQILVAAGGESGQTIRSVR